MPFMTLCQELAENFYPERADFTRSHGLGDEFAGGLATSAPVLARRDLANQFQAMLRPRGKDWFNQVPEDEELMERPDIVEFSKRLSDIQRRAMNDYRSMFGRATKQGDNDFATFGQCVISVEADMLNSRLLYRNWHLRDVAWTENYSCEISNIYRKWNPTARQLVGEYRDKVHQKVKDLTNQDKQDEEVRCLHIIMPFDEYDYSEETGKRNNPNGRFKYVAVCVDKDNEHIISETPLEDHPYVIPRWQLVSGSQYAHSPASHYALPDARTLQAISYTLLKSGELAVDPPLIAVEEQIRSDINLRPGGVTWVDADYDEKTGEVLRPLNRDTRNLGFGVNLSERVMGMVQEAFFLNKINLPPMSNDMTATEVQIRTQEYIRNALPLFEPMETEYNGPLCDKTFNVLLRVGTFGRPQDWPEEMRNAEMKFQFESPLLEATRKEDAARFMEAANLLAAAVQLDPSLKDEWDYRKDFRKAMGGLQASLVDEEDAGEARSQMQEAQQAQQAMGLLSQGANVTQQVGVAGKAINEMVAQQQTGVAA